MESTVANCARYIADIRNGIDIDISLERLCEQLGYDQYCLILYPRSPLNDHLKVRYTNYPTEWIASYVEKGLWKYDPSLRHLSSGSSYVQVIGPAAKDEIADQDNDEGSKVFAREADHFGIDSGVTAPLQGSSCYGFLNLNGDTCPDKMLPLELVGASILQAVADATNASKADQVYDLLSVRERQVLYWASRGKTASETSQIIGITERTVTAHVSSSLQKLNCTNKVQAVAVVAPYLHHEPTPI